MDLDPVRLRTLDRIAVLGSMTAAANALGYTTGAVSQQMAALERITGHKLLNRVGRNIQLTDAGTVLARHARRVLAAQDAARLALEEVYSTLAVRVNVGVFATAGAALLAPALGSIASDYPQLEVRSTEVDVDDAIAAAAQGEVDLAFGIDYDEAPIPRDADVRLTALRTEIFSIGHRRGTLSAHRPLRLVDLAEQRWILPTENSHYGLAFRLACRRAGFEPQVAHEVTDTATTLSMAAEGLGIAPVTDLMLRWRGPDLDVAAIGDHVTRRIVLAHRTPLLRTSVRTVADALARFVRAES